MNKLGKELKGNVVDDDDYEKPSKSSETYIKRKKNYNHDVKEQILF